MAFRYAMSRFIPFRDEQACARVRAIRRTDITKHTNPDFRIEVIEDRTQFYSRFAIDMVERIQKAGREGRKCVLILPVGPVPQYAIAAEMIRPWVSPDAYWIVKVHQDFQGMHYYARMGLDPMMRLKHRDHRAYQLATVFADQWAQTAFDPDYEAPTASPREL